LTRTSALASVVVPAHNEAAVIGRCLDSLLDGFKPGELQVVVACNGCTDGTADIVRSSGHDVRVIEVTTASKVAALRAADEILSTFPRIYLDADVVLAGTAARRVINELRIGGSLVARPPIEYDTNRSSLLVRSYYRARIRVPSVMNAVWGAGMYGLSAAGRSRFGAYPDVVADDFFVDQHFRRAEIKIVDAPPVVVGAPRRTADLMRILRRTYQGNSEIRLLPDRSAQETETTPSTVRALVRVAIAEPLRAVDVALYMALAVYARVSLSIVAPRGWERDDGSRAV